MSKAQQPRSSHTEGHVDVPAKPAWASWTILINGAAILAGIIGIVLEMATPLEIPPQTVVYLTLALAIVNFLLRFKTVQPIAFSSDTIETLRPKDPGSQTLEKVS